MSKLLTTEEFIEKANKVHNFKYSYTKTVYTNCKNKIIIICPTHGEFKQVADKHLYSGCRKCATEYNARRRRFTTIEFIKKANLIHNNEYDYSDVVYINNHTKISIICSLHGLFLQTPANHLRGAKCMKCAKKIHGIKLTSTTKEFIKKAKLKHNNKYGYKFVNYISNIIPVKIICKKHGIFEQKPVNHLSGSGCPICKESKGEIIIEEYLKQNKILFERQKSFEGCKFKRRLKFDFYLPCYKVLIEFDGEQHFRNKFYLKENEFNEIKTRDQIKTNWCIANKYKLLRITYKEINNINSILYVFLSKFGSIC